MSRSFKHTPIFGNGGGSEKEDKRIFHGKKRTIIRSKMVKVFKEESSEEYIDPEQNEVWNVWSMGKDGKGYWTPSPYNPVKLWPEYPGQSEEDIKKAMRK